MSLTENGNQGRDVAVPSEWKVRHGLIGAGLDGQHSQPGSPFADQGFADEGE
jgi:hypothetical protein